MATPTFHELEPTLNNNRADDRSIGAIRCPCEQVCAHLMQHEFGPAASGRLASIDSLAPDDAVPCSSESRNYIRGLEALACYCRYCLERVLRHLLEWREQLQQQLVRAQPGRDSGSVVAAVAESRIDIDHKLIAVDIVFCETSIVCMSLFDSPDVGERFAVEVEKSVRACCRASAGRIIASQSRKKAAREILFGTTKPSLSLLSTRNHYSFELWTMLLGRLSASRLASIANSFVHALVPNDKLISALLLKSLRAVHIRIDSSDHLQQSMAFVRALFRIFDCAKGLPELKDAVCITLTNILYPLALQKRHHSNLKDWYTLMASLFLRIRRWLRRPKHASVAYPLLVTVLCVCDPEHFISNFGYLLDALIAFYQEPSSRLVAGACIQRLVHVYLEQIAFRRNATSNHLNAIVTQVILTPRKPLAFVDGDAQREHDALVALVLTIAEGNFDFCIRHVILRLLLRDAATNALGTHVQIALRALTAIFDCGERRTALFTSVDADVAASTLQGRFGPSIGTMLFDIDERLRSLAPFERADLAPYDVELAGAIAAVLCECHRRIGHLLLSKPDAKPVDDDAFEQHHMALVVHRFALGCLPFVWNTSMTMSNDDLMRLVCEAMIHRNDGVRNAAFYVAFYIASKRVDLLELLLSQLASFVLASVPVTMADVVLPLLTLLADIVEECERASLNDATRTVVEATALFWLCSTSRVVRFECLRTLVFVRRLTPYDDDDGSDEKKKSSLRPPLIVQIEEHEDAVVAAFNKRTMPPLDDGQMQSDALDDKTIDRSQVARLCEQTSAIRVVHAACCGGGSPRWSSYLAELLRQLSHARNATLLRLALDATTRKLDLYWGSSTPRLLLWRNVALFALIASSTSGGTSPVVVSMVNELRRTRTRPRRRTLALTALGSVPLCIADHTLGNLDVAEHDDDEGFRVAVAFVYRLVAEGLAPAFLRDHVKLRTRFVAFIRGTRRLLEKRGARPELKQHFVVVVQRFCEETFATPCSTPLDADERLRLFKLLVRTTATSDVASLTAMAALLLGPFLDGATNAVPDALVFPWLHSVLRSPDRKVRDIGSVGLQNVLCSTPDTFVDYFLRQSYGGDDVLARRYFLVLGEVWMMHADGVLRLKLAEIIHLVIFKLGDDSFTVRSMALDMLPVLAEKRPGLVHGRQAPHLVISSRLPDTYEHAQREMSRRLSIEYDQCRVEVLEAIWQYAKLVNGGGGAKLRMLRYSEAWLQGAFGREYVDLLFSVTVEGTTSDELPRLWHQLCTNDADVDFVLGFVLERAAAAGDDVVLRACKTVALYVSRVHYEASVSLLLRQLPIAASSPPPPPSPPPTQSLMEEQLALLDATDNDDDDDDDGALEKAPCLYPASEFSREQHDEHNYSNASAALLLLVEIAYEMEADSVGVENLVALLHIGVLGLDHARLDVREHSKFLLLNIVHSLVFRNDNETDANDEELDFDSCATSLSRRKERRVAASALMDRLMSKDGSELWSRELISDANPTPSSAAEFGAVVQALIDVLEQHAIATPNERIKVGELASLWALRALEWWRSTSSSSELVACRCLQALRALLPRLARTRLAAALGSLALARPLPPSDAALQSEVLLTLGVLLDRLSITDAMSDSATESALPPLFWCCVALLRRRAAELPAHVFVQTCAVLQRLLPRLTASAVLSASASDDAFGGLQPLLLHGLRRRTTRVPACVLLARLAERVDPTLVDVTPLRDLLNMAALLPTLLRRRSTAMARSLRRVCERRLQQATAVFRRLENDADATLDLEALAPPFCAFMQALDGDARVCALLIEQLDDVNNDDDDDDDDGDECHGRFVVRVLAALFDALDWRRSSLRFGAAAVLRALLALLEGPLRADAQHALGVVLRRTCGLEGASCDVWSGVGLLRVLREQRRPATPLLTPEPTPPPSVHEPEPQEQEQEEPEQEEEDERRESDEDELKHTWSGDWARRRREHYSTHSRRLGLISKRWNTEQQQRRQRHREQRHRSRPKASLYPDLYRRQDGEQETKVPKEATAMEERKDDPPVGEDLGEDQRTSSTSSQSSRRRPKFIRRHMSSRWAPSAPPAWSRTSSLTSDDFGQMNMPSGVSRRPSMASMLRRQQQQEQQQSVRTQFGSSSSSRLPTTREYKEASPNGPWP